MSSCLLRRLVESAEVSGTSLGENSSEDVQEAGQGGQRHRRREEQSGWYTSRRPVVENDTVDTFAGLRII